MATLTQLGKAIADQRRHLGLTQEELGARIGITLNSISRIETGKSDISQERLAAIASALDTTVADLMSLANLNEVEAQRRERLAVRETGRSYSPDGQLTLPSKVFAHAHRKLAELAEEGADEYALNMARKLLLEPERYTYSVSGRVMLIAEEDIMKDMDALATWAREVIRDRKRLMPQSDRAVGGDPSGY